MPRKSQRFLRELTHPLYRKLETTVHPLRYLFLEVTQRCNLACRHCGSDCGREVHSDELTTAEWLALFDALAEHFDPRTLLLVITGGEPLCHPELDRLIERLAHHGFRFGVVTNGWALTPARIAKLVASGAVTFTVSLDGMPTSHDWLRGREGAHARALRSIAALAAARCPFDVVTCVHPRNLDELPAVRQLLESQGVPGWRLFSIFPRGRARGARELLLSPEELRRLFAFITAERQRPGRAMEIDYGCEGYLAPEVDRSVRDEPYFCRAGISIGSVLADGAISACPNIPRSLAQGNVRRDDFATVWEQRFAPFRERAWMQAGTCRDCGLFARCKGNSMHLWDEVRGGTLLCTFEAQSGHPPPQQAARHTTQT